MKRLVALLASLGLSMALLGNAYAVDYLRADSHEGEHRERGEYREHGERGEHGQREGHGWYHNAAPRVIYYAAPTVYYSTPYTTSSYGTTYYNVPDVSYNGISYNGVDNYGTTTIYYANTRVLPSVPVTRYYNSGYQVRGYNYDRPHGWHDSFNRPRSWHEAHEQDERHVERHEDRD